jgi:hypothetical protein
VASLLRCGSELFADAVELVPSIHVDPSIHPCLSIRQC